ncbi:MAG: hypothetical protein ACI9R3_005028 [Verrucomicrobiales bacterium]|jgi:hypothetical protein
MKTMSVSFSIPMMMISALSSSADHFPGYQRMGECRAELEEALRACRYTALDLKRVGRRSRRISRLQARYQFWLNELEKEAVKSGVRLVNPLDSPTCARPWLDARLAIAIDDSVQTCRLIEQADRVVRERVRELFPSVISLGRHDETGGGDDSFIRVQ